MMEGRSGNPADVMLPGIAAPVAMIAPALVYSASVEGQRRDRRRIEGPDRLGHVVEPRRVGFLGEGGLEPVDALRHRVQPCAARINPRMSFAAAGMFVPGPKIALTPAALRKS